VANLVIFIPKNGEKIFNKNHKIGGVPFGFFCFSPFFFICFFWAFLVRRAYKRRKITCARALSSTSDGDDGLAMPQQPLFAITLWEL